jgi:nitroimidazol reductase NimA-like FMN-containing flavoprotein (pyridoxamine 5'-phosphate oxidase superfamily)
MTSPSPTAGPAEMSTGETAAQTVRDIIEASRYLVLATADAAGRPWSSPVYFAHIDFAEFSGSGPATTSGPAPA